jgi:hypothetical protein
MVNRSVQNLCLLSFIRTHIHTYVLAYILTYIHTYIHTYMHTYTYTHTYTRTYVHMYMCTDSFHLIKVHYRIFFPMARQPLGGQGRLIFGGFTITLSFRHTTLGRSLLDEGPARRSKKHCFLERICSHNKWCKSSERHGDDYTPQQRTNMCTCFLKQAVMTPAEDGLSISRNICWGFYLIF